MKKILRIFICLLATSAFADSIILDNETSHPNKNAKSKIAIQWANSTKEIDEWNKALMNGTKLDSNTFQVLTKSGKIQVAIPKGAEYFRIVAWSKGEKNPDLHTNWVDIVPNKTYTLKSDHLVPSILMLGMGC